MSESILPEYCPVCGGVTGSHAREKVIALKVVGHLSRVCPGHLEPAEKHDGNLGHNTTVFYSDEKYIADDGEVFFNREVCLSDKMRHICIVPKEALSLLAWLKQEESKLEQLAREGE